MPELLDRELELLDQQGPRLGLGFRGQPDRSLGAQHRLQRGHVVGKRIIGAHRRPENHIAPTLSELPVVLSIQIPAISQPPAVARYVAASANRCPPARVHRNIPSGESDESPAIEVTVREPAHPLFGHTFRVIRSSVHLGGGLPLSYEVEYRDGASLLIPVAATEPRTSMENRTKLSVEALHDLTSLVEQLEHDADRSKRALGHAANGTAAPNPQRGRRSAGGGKA